MKRERKAYLVWRLLWRWTSEKGWPPRNDPHLCFVCYLFLCFPLRRPSVFFFLLFALVCFFLFSPLPLFFCPQSSVFVGDVLVFHWDLYTWAWSLSSRGNDLEDKVRDFVFWLDWDTNSPAIVGLLVVVSFTR